TRTSTLIARSPPQTGDKRYTAHGKAIVFVVAIRRAGRPKRNPVCKLTDNMGGDESQSIASSPKRKVPFISTRNCEQGRVWDGMCLYSGFMRF
ncbi:MAG: hypothetical protein IJK87_02565, partial [Prevotella sp.]|nr:hypothetical protein [Prevotella sp.]